MVNNRPGKDAWAESRKTAMLTSGILHSVDANAVFAKLPKEVNARLKQAGWIFYSFIGGGARFMCSWKTTGQDITALLTDARGR